MLQVNWQKFLGETSKRQLSKVSWHAETNDEKINLPLLSYCIIAVTRLNCPQVGFQVLRNQILHLLFGHSVATGRLKNFWPGPNKDCNWKSVAIFASNNVFLIYKLTFIMLSLLCRWSCLISLCIQWTTWLVAISWLSSNNSLKGGTIRSHWMQHRRKDLTKLFKSVSANILQNKSSTQGKDSATFKR